MNRVGDIYSAVDYLVTVPFVDAEGIGILGICAGGGYSVKAASLDHRIKAVATASAANVGNAAPKGRDGKNPLSGLPGTLDMLVKQRTAEANGAEMAYAPYVPKDGESSPFRDLREGADDYCTPRGQHSNAPNKLLMTSLIGWVAFDAFVLVDPLLTQPLMICAGSEADSLWQGRELHAKTPDGNKELVIIEGATHMGLYDGPGRDAVLDKLTPFFNEGLSKRQP